MLNNSRGFSLMELIAVIAIMAILAALAYPSFSRWRENAQYREASRNIVSTLRDARATAIGRSNPHRVTLELGNRRLYFQAMNADGNYDAAVMEKTIELPSVVRLRSGVGACDNAANISLEFRPDGSVILPGAAPYRICVQDNPGANRFFVNITSAATGRMEIVRP